MDYSRLLGIFISAVFVNNVILSRFLGLCPFVAVSKDTKQAFAMSMAVTFVTTLSSAITWLVYMLILVPFGLMYLRTMVFILIIATFVQLVEMIIRKTSPVLYRAFGIYLVLITTNCAVLGVAVLNIDMFFTGSRPIHGSFMFSVFQGLCVGAGYTAAMLLMSAIRERLEVCGCPKALQGLPLAFIVASLMSLAFMGFNGFKF